VTKNSRKRIL